MKDDTISRQALLDTVDLLNWYHQNKNGEMVHGANSDEHQAWYKADDVYTAIESVPSAQPGWIPCTPETMPPDYQWYYATCKSLVDNRENWVVEGCYTPWEHFDSTPMIKCGDAEVIAWMPKGFPEPWEGDTDAH